MSLSPASQLKESATTMSSWLRFLGIALIFTGALCAFTIIGLFVFWIPIWMGVLLYQAAERATAVGRGTSAEALLELVEKLKSYFIISGVVTMALIAFVVCFLIFMYAVMDGPPSELGTFLFN